MYRPVQGGSAANIRRKRRQAGESILLVFPVPRSHPLNDPWKQDRWPGELGQVSFKQAVHLGLQPAQAVTTRMNLRLTVYTQAEEG